MLLAVVLDFVSIFDLCATANAQVGNIEIMHIALIEPEIPGNTGSIGRVCVGTGTSLHLIGKLGFSLDESYVRRAGLDYWKHVDLHRHADVDGLIAALPNCRLHFFTARHEMQPTPQRYDKIAYHHEDILVFGSETKGFTPEIRQRFGAHFVHVPTNGQIRSLNLANVVTAALYEALRQQDFPV